MRLYKWSNASLRFISHNTVLPLRDLLIALMAADKRHHCARALRTGSAPGKCSLSWNLTCSAVGPAAATCLIPLCFAALTWHRGEAAVVCLHLVYVISLSFTLLLLFFRVILHHYALLTEMLPGCGGLCDFASCVGGLQSKHHKISSLLGSSLCVDPKFCTL